MSERIPQSIAKRVSFKAFLAADHVTAATGKTIPVQISKNGAAFANLAMPANATSIGNGWYYIQLAIADCDTLGPLVVRGTEATIDPAEVVYEVALAKNAGFTLPDAPTDWLTAAAVKADAVTKIGASVNVGSIYGSALAAKALAARYWAYQDDGVIVLDLSACDTDVKRGDAFIAALTAVQALTPGGAAITSRNRAKLKMPTARYNTQANEPTITVDGIDLIAIDPIRGGHRQETDYDYSDGSTSLDEFRPTNVVIYTTTNGKRALIQNASDVRMIGITAAQLSGGIAASHGLYVSHDDNEGSIYDRCYFWHKSPCRGANGSSGVGFAKHVNGLWIDCVGNSASWTIGYDAAYASQFSADMYDCEAGAFSIIGDYATGFKGTHKATLSRFERCKCVGRYNDGTAYASGYAGFSGCTSFANDIDGTCVFVECESGNNSFGIGATIAGKFYRCRGGTGCFGSTVSGSFAATFSGYAEDCYGGDGSFGGYGLWQYTIGRLTGKLVRCCVTSGRYTTHIAGAMIVESTFEGIVADIHTLTLMDSLSRISKSTLIATGTGNAIYAASSRTFSGADNTYVGGLHANVTNSGIGDQVTPTTASKTGYALVVTPPTAEQIKTAIEATGSTLAAIVEDTGETLPVLIGVEGGTAAEVWAYASRVLTSSGEVSITSPVAANLDVSITQHDDYSATATPPLDWANSKGDWLAGNIASAVVTMTIKDKGGTTILTKVGTVVTATGTQAVRIVLTQANTALLTLPGQQYSYQLHLTKAGEQSMIASGDVIVTPSLDLTT